jgi:hypothetical protein
LGLFVYASFFLPRHFPEGQELYFIYCYIPHSWHCLWPENGRAEIELGSLWRRKYKNKMCYFYLFIFWCFYGQGIALVRQAVYHLSHTFSLFCFSCFSNRDLLYAWASLDHDPPIYAFHVAGMMGVHYHA